MRNSPGHRCAPFTLAFCVSVLAVALSAPREPRADVFDVNVLGDTFDGICDLVDCSIRDAIAAANGNFQQDIINLPPGTITLTRGPADPDTLDIATGDLDVTESVLIFGAGESLTTIDGGGSFRVLNYSAPGSFELRGVTIRGGSTTGRGGAVRISNGTANLITVVIEGNAATDGGGVAVETGAFTQIRGATLRNNLATGRGGALFNEFSTAVEASTIGPGNTAGLQGGGWADYGQLFLSNSTISGNSAPEGAGLFTCSLASNDISYTTIARNVATVGASGGIANAVTGCAGTDITSSIVAENVPANCADEFGGAAVFNSTDHDVSDDPSCNLTDPTDQQGVPDAGIEDLALNGGFTETHALAPGSPARDAGNPASCPFFDQRDQLRPQGPECDAGSYEAEPDFGFALGPGSGLTFGQVDFYPGTGLPAEQIDSPWGRVEVDVALLTGSTGIADGFVNVYNDVGWVIQNLPVVTTDPFTPSTYFDLGVTPGTDVTSMPVYATFGGSVQTAFPDGPRTSFGFQPFVFDAAGIPDEDPGEMGAPPPPETGTLSGPTFRFTTENLSNVQAARNQCAPMSVANSLQYLEDSFASIDIAEPHTAGLGMDGSLVGRLETEMGRTITSRSDGRGVGFAPFMRGKFRYLTEEGIAADFLNRHQGYGYGSSALPPGDFTEGDVTSQDESAGGKVTFEWLCQQIEDGEDVELAYRWTSGSSSGGHAVRVYQCGETAGKKWVRIAHDRIQNGNNDPDDSRGLETPLVYISDLDGDGLLNFGSAGREIVFAISESPVDDTAPKLPVAGPLAFVLLSLLLGGAGVTTLLRGRP